MKREISVLLNLVRLNTRLFTNALEGVSNEEALRRINDKTNNISFIALHVLDARYYLCGYLGEDIPNPFNDTLDNINSIEQMTEYPRLETIITHWEEISPRLEAALQKLEPERYNLKSDTDFPVEDKSILGGISFLIQHESYHIGQISFIRKYLGLNPMSYS